MDYCARLSTLEESHRFLNREFMQISDTWTKAALLSKGLLTKAASIMPPLSTFCPFRPLAHFLCQSRFDARSPVHTNRTFAVAEAFWLFCTDSHCSAVCFQSRSVKKR